MNLAGLKSLLGNAAELLKSDKTESPQPTGLLDVSKKNKNDNPLATDISYDNRIMKAITNRFVEARNTKESGAASSPKSIWHDRNRHWKKEHSMNGNGEKRQVNIQNRILNLKTIKVAKFDHIADGCVRV